MIDERWAPSIGSASGDPARLQARAAGAAAGTFCDEASAYPLEVVVTVRAALADHRAADGYGDGLLDANGDVRRLRQAQGKPKPVVRSFRAVGRIVEDGEQLRHRGDHGLTPGGTSVPKGPIWRGQWSLRVREVSGDVGATVLPKGPRRSGRENGHLPDDQRATGG